MELIRTLKERHQTQRQANIEKEAEYRITVDDFNSSLFIAYDGTPLVPIQESWTSKEIIQELDKVRQNFINSKLR